MKIYSKIGIFIITLSFAGCSGHRKMQKQVFLKNNTPITHKKDNTQPTIMIWVHGTQPSTKTLQWLHNIVQKPLSMVNKELILPYTHTNPGLLSASTLEKNHYISGIITTICTQNPAHYQFDHCYFFGWSGQLSFASREKAAAQLHKELLSLLDQYEKKYGCKPLVHIITHSHGGNVVLNVAKVAQQNPGESFTIDQLILLACPVQEETASFIRDPLFANIYSFYSKADFVQIIDPQGLYHAKNRTPLFSKRCFADHEKLKQVQVTLNDGHIFHISFLFKRFIQHLPAIVQEVDNWFAQEPTKIGQKRKLDITI